MTKKKRTYEESSSANSDRDFVSRKINFVSLPAQLQAVISYVNSSYFQGQDLAAQKAAVNETLLYLQDLLALTDLNVDLDPGVESKRLDERLIQYRLTAAEAKKTRTYHREKITKLEEHIHELEKELSATKKISPNESIETEDIENGSTEHEHTWEVVLQAVTQPKSPNNDEVLKDRIKQLEAENANLRKINMELAAQCQQSSTKFDIIKNAIVPLVASASQDLQFLQQVLQTIISDPILKDAVDASQKLAQINSAIAQMGAYFQKHYARMQAAYEAKGLPIPTAPQTFAYDMSRAAAQSTPFVVSTLPNTQTTTAEHAAYRHI